MPKALPIGAMDFRSAVRRTDEAYVDKSAFIGRVLADHAAAIVICRPRRFGKTLNITMLREFLEKPIPHDIVPPRDPFAGMVVLRDPVALSERNQHPVLYLSLKGAKARTWADCLRQIAAELASAWLRQNADLGLLPAQLQAKVAAIASEVAAEPDCAAAIRTLTTALQRLHGRAAWLMIDEYDAPLQTAWEYGFYPEAVAFFRGFFGQGIKDNPAVAKTIMTGILRVAKEGIFSDLNNVVVDTVLSNRFAGDFGFTEAEVTELAGDDPPFLAELRHWYNGYQLGDFAMYNPWSVANALSHDKPTMEAHWVASGGTGLLERLLTHAPPEVARKLERLLLGEAVECVVVDGVAMPAIERHPEMLFTMLLHAGYLTAIAVRRIEDETLAKLRVPNHEVRTALRGLYRSWLNERGHGVEQVQKLIAGLLAGDAVVVQEMMAALVLGIMSYHDLADRTPERVYHAFVLGMLTQMPAGYQIASNREYGDGRPDVVMVPADGARPAVLLEFKKAAVKEVVASAALRAEAQIVARNYAAAVAGTPVRAWAIGFDRRNVLVGLVGDG